MARFDVYVCFQVKEKYGIQELQRLSVENDVSHALPRLLTHYADFLSTASTGTAADAVPALTTTSNDTTACTLDMDGK
jgi:hypothetical protein